MRGRRLFAVAAILLAVPAAAADRPSRTAAERVAALWVEDELVPFSDEAEFTRYMRDVRAAARSRGLGWARAPSEPGTDIIVTGSRVIPRNASITNVQEAGVDEGDVVKQIGQYLIILQDGRLFSIDTRAGADGELALADRVNVYRRPDDDSWYDELLVRGDWIVVTAYSYGDEASKLLTFRLTPDGRFEREALIEIDSGDYWDSRNYATRLIGDNLVISTSVDLARRGVSRFPRARRIDAGQTGRNEPRPRTLFDAGDLFRPIVETLEPEIHSVSVCPLGQAGQGRDLSCRTRAVIGTQGRRLYVTPTHIYLWNGPERAWIGPDCAPGHRASFDSAQQATLYRIPVGRGAPEAIAVRGRPADQFSLDEHDGALRALLMWEDRGCYAAEDLTQVALLSVPLSRFGRWVTTMPARSYAPLPAISGSDIANRFTGSHLAYAPLREYRYEAENEGRRDAQPLSTATQLLVVTVADPGSPSRIPLSHNVHRLEVAGDHFLVSGNMAGAGEGTTLSLIDTGGGARLASSLHLGRRYDGEGRSHAFNLRLAADGSGIFGLPTIETPAPSSVSWWSLPSDLSFFALDAGGGMKPLGVLASRMPRIPDRDEDERLLDGEPDQDTIAGYSCEVSCVDWYGNSRPIFTDGRIFGLSATELIEGRMDGDRIVEVRRLDFARAAPRAR